MASAQAPQTSPPDDPLRPGPDTNPGVFFRYQMFTDGIREQGIGCEMLLA
jgi:hypothetical protein